MEIIDLYMITMIWRNHFDPHKYKNLQDNWILGSRYCWIISIQDDCHAQMVGFGAHLWCFLRNKFSSQSRIETCKCSLLENILRVVPLVQQVMEIWNNFVQNTTKTQLHNSPFKNQLLRVFHCFTCKSSLWDISTKCSLTLKLKVKVP